MGYTYKKRIAKRSNYGSKRSTDSIDYLVFHYTANDGDTAMANANYFRNNYVGASAHYFVDDSNVVQSVPDNYVAWSVGSRGYLDQGSPFRASGHKFWGKCTNANSISIEMCDTKHDGKHNLSAATRANAIALGIKLCKQYNIPASHVIRHFDVNGKLCPIYFVTNEDDWKDFRDEIAEGLNDSKPAPKHTSKVVLNARGYFKQGDTGWKVGNLERYLKAKGFYNGNIDNDYGPQMARAVCKFEKKYKLDQDGMFGKKCLKYVDQ
jgi:N-acetylmuramoyl-L-alanine amidase CwlA